MANPKPNQNNLAPRFSENNQPKRKAGRPKGSKNKNNFIRDLVEKNFTGGVEGYVTNLLEEIAEIDNIVKRVDAYTKLMPYIAPQLKAIDASIALDDKTGGINIIYHKASDVAKDKPSDKPDVEIK